MFWRIWLWLFQGSSEQVQADPPQVTSTFDMEYTVEAVFNIGDYGVPPVAEIDYRKYFVSDIRRFKIKDITKNGSPWTLTAATLYLVQPDGTILTKTATQLAPYEWGYTTVAGDLSVAGEWRRYWLVTDGSSPNRYGEYTFTVKAVV